MPRDDLGEPYRDDPTRIVSLVPSLTEAVAVSARSLLVGATDWCSHPPDLELPRVGGTKYPTLDRILRLRPDLVLANAEENRPEDVAALRDAGVPVWVTYPQDVPGAIVSLDRMFGALGVPRPQWLDEAEAVWSGPPAASRRWRAVVPVWRRPWVVLGRDTFAGDVLARLGVDNVYADDAQRYPRPSVPEMLARRPELVVLPDEPYAFTADDGPEAFGGVPTRLVSGRHLTWYGPSLVPARRLLEQQLT